jgi:hypothetical protein
MLPVAAGEACVRRRSRRKPDIAVFQVIRGVRIGDGFVRSRPAPNAAFGSCYKGPWMPVAGVKNMRRRFIVADLRFIK